MHNELRNNPHSLYLNRDESIGEKHLSNFCKATGARNFSAGGQCWLSRGLRLFSPWSGGGEPVSLTCRDLATCGNKGLCFYILPQTAGISKRWRMVESVLHMKDVVGKCKAIGSPLIICLGGTKFAHCSHRHIIREDYATVTCNALKEHRVN